MSEHLDQLVREETPPRAGAMINTFRAFGYDLKTAIADIIDNSISAKAKNIWIEYAWNGIDSSVTITDDGIGMDLETLIQAMTPGSKDPNEERDENDLGRFGLGLKTSSFSQCKSLTVITKSQDNNLIKRCWDLDYVNKTQKWNLLDYLSDERFKLSLEELQSGTTVVWQKLDRLVGKSNVENEAARNVFLEEFEKVEEHLSLVFHRYIEQNKINLWINGEKILPWDPFMKDLSEIVAREKLDNDKITVKCYLIPHISKLSAKQRISAKAEKWHALQGFYIYRNSRLLLYGDWLGLFRKNEHFKNARILIDIPNDLDHEWKIDIKKATASPSIKVRKDLIRLGKLARKAAGKIYRFRGNEVMINDKSSTFSYRPLWKVSKSRDDSRHYFINREHPVIAEFLEKESISSQQLKKILGLIGETIPIESIVQFHSEDPESHELRSNSRELDEGTLELAKMMFESLKKSGLSKENARNQIFKIEPFEEYPQLIEYLT